MKSIRSLINRKKYVILLCTFAFLFSCKKKIFEVVPMLTIEKQMNISGAGNIKYFSFPSALVGYAASDSSFIYKTTDGGSNWTKLKWVNGKVCKGIEFFDENKGMCLMSGVVYVTADGGANWNSSLNADFIAISGDGLTGIIGDCPNDMLCDISITANQGQSFSFLGQAPIKGNFSFVEIDGSNVILFGQEVYYYDFTFGYDISNAAITKYEFDNITNNEMPSSFHLSGGKGFLVGQQGMIHENKESTLYGRSYYVHNYNYHSVDGLGNTVICVGDKTITTNLSIDGDTEWKEAVDKDQNGFTENFYKIKLIDERSFYLSGSNGTLFKAKI